MVGQFLSVDEKQGNAQGADPYSYVAGNPETMTDPTGHWAWWQAALVAVAVVAVVAVVAAPALVGFVAGAIVESAAATSAAAIAADAAAAGATASVATVEGAGAGAAGIASTIGWITTFGSAGSVFGQMYGDYRVGRVSSAWDLVKAGAYGVYSTLWGSSRLSNAAYNAAGQYQNVTSQSTVAAQSTTVAAQSTTIAAQSTTIAEQKEAVFLSKPRKPDNRATEVATMQQKFRNTAPDYAFKAFIAEMSILGDNVGTSHSWQPAPILFGKNRFI